MRAKEQRVSSVWKPLTKTQRKTVLCPVGELDDLNIATAPSICLVPDFSIFCMFFALKCFRSKKF